MYVREATTVMEHLLHLMQTQICLQDNLNLPGTEEMHY
jgi:hypothetical protein